MSEYLYVVQMDIPPEREADFNRIYDTQHVPEITKVPGVLGVKRYKLEKSSNAGYPVYLAFMFFLVSPVTVTVKPISASIRASRRRT